MPDYKTGPARRRNPLAVGPARRRKARLLVVWVVGREPAARARLPSGSRASAAVWPDYRSRARLLSSSQIIVIIKIIVVTITISDNYNNNNIDNRGDTHF